MKKMNSTELIEKATESFERLDKSYVVDRVDYTKGYIACYMDVVNESKVIHNVSTRYVVAIKNEDGLTKGKKYELVRLHKTLWVVIVDDTGEEVIYHHSYVE